MLRLNLDASIDLSPISVVVSVPNRERFEDGPDRTIHRREASASVTRVAAGGRGMVNIPLRFEEEGYYRISITADGTADERGTTSVSRRPRPRRVPRAHG